MIDLHVFWYFTSFYFGFMRVLYLAVYILIMQRPGVVLNILSNKAPLFGKKEFYSGYIHIYYYYLFLLYYTKRTDLV